MRSKKNINPVFLASLAVLPIVATTIGCTTKEKEKDPKTPTPSPNPNILQDKNFEFVENSDGTLKINKYLGKDTNVTIPSEYKGKKVTTIGEYAFCYSFYDELYGKNIETINLPNSIKTIEKYAFWANHSIKKINLNEGLEKIGDFAFGGTKISLINIPSSVKEIGNGAFKGTEITLINIPSSVKEIGKSAFNSCSNLYQVTLNEGLEKIGDFAFGGTKISLINIPSSVKEIGNGAFSSCYDLSQVTLNEGLEKIGDSAFKDTKITSITIPSSVKEIGNNAFAGFYSRLKKIICKVPRDKITWKWSDLNATYNWNWTVEYV